MASGAQNHVLVIPYPAQGHMLPLLDLAHLLSLHDPSLLITVAITPGNLPVLSPLLSSTARPRARPRGDMNMNMIQPLILPFPDYPALPAGVENTKDLPPSISSFFLLMHAHSHLHSPLLSWARSHPSPPSSIISDFFLGWTHALASDLAVPRLTFCPSGALALCVTNYLWRKNDDVSPHHPVRFTTLPGSPVYTWDQISSVYRKCVDGDPLSDFIREGFLANIRSWGFVFNTLTDVEETYLEHMRTDLGHGRVWAVGPLSLARCTSSGDRGGPNSAQARELLAWLDGLEEEEEEEGSVVYVCFGSQAVLSEAQAEAVGAGLERSGARFVWCMRAGAAGPDEDYERRVGGRGRVVKGWTPQVEVLEHRAVGWFLTHCGWNSIMEGLAAGVGMLTWPMGADQYYNTRLVVEEVGIGVSVCQGKDTVPDPDDLARVLAEAAIDGRREKEKAKAKEMKGKAMAAVREGGSSWRDLDALVKQLTTVC